MPVSPSDFAANHLLRTLPAGVRGEVAPDFDLVQLERLDHMERPRVEIEHVYFPSSGLASVVTIGDRARDQRIETGIFGREGMSGVATVLGVEHSLQEIYVQIPGQALTARPASVVALMERHPPFAALLRRYAYVQLIQTACTALANGSDTVETRLARWILMADDRVDGEVLSLTHEFLALMLGVRRAGVTISLQNLESKGLIGRTRGAILVLDRAGLLSFADGVYGIPEAEYERLIGPLG